MEKEIIILFANLNAMINIPNMLRYNIRSLTKNNIYMQPFHSEVFCLNTLPNKKKKTNSEKSHSGNTLCDQENNIEIKDVPEGYVCLSQFKTL